MDAGPELELNALREELVGDGARIWDRARKAVELGHPQGLAGTDGRERLVEAGPGAPCRREAVMTVDQRTLAVRLIAEGKSVREAAGLLNCHPATLYRALPAADLSPD